MIVRDEALQHIATDINYEGMKYCALMAIVDENGVTSELRWATGNKEVHNKNM